MRPEAVVKVEPPRVVVSVDVAVVLAGEVCWVQDICGVVLHVDDAAGPIALLLRASGGGEGEGGGGQQEESHSAYLPKIQCDPGGLTSASVKGRTLTATLTLSAASVPGSSKFASEVTSDTIDLRSSSILGHNFKVQTDFFVGEHKIILFVSSFSLGGKSLLVI